MSFWDLLKGVRVPRAVAPSPPSDLEPPAKAILPLRQHQGRVCEPAVSEGDQVALGQVVGSSGEFEAAAVHASVSGTVEAITEVTDPSGQPVPAVVIANDGRDAWFEPEEGGVPALSGLEEVAGTRPTRLLRRLRDAGLVRAATLGLPLHVDLSPPMAPRSYLFMTGIPVVRPIDTLIVRAVDPDPPVAPNQAALAAEDGRLEVGVAALARISGAKRVILAVPPGGDAAGLAALAERHEWELARVDARHYPFATDNLLVHRLTGRVVPTPYGEPRDVGVVLEPLLTALDVGQVLTTGRPVVDRVFSVAGDVAQPQTFRVRLGTPVGQVIQAAGGLPAEPGKVILGGPMRGYAHFDLDTPVTKETGGVLVQSAQRVRAFANEPCIHCGRCVAACPVNLVPAELSKLCEFHQFEEAAERDLLHCIECGCCAYVCPARRPMVHLLRYGKSEVLAERMEL
jgi:electron transport complex protein RnfC